MRVREESEDDAQPEAGQSEERQVLVSPDGDQHEADDRLPVQVGGIPRLGTSSLSQNHVGEGVGQRLVGGREDVAVSVGRSFKDEFAGAA